MLTDELIAGTFAGIFGIIPFYPLDTLKSRTQTRPNEYTTTLNLLKTMIRKEGFCSLYRGVLSPMVSYGAINGSVFLARGLTRDALKSGSPVPRPLTFKEECFVGGSAGFWSSFVRSPMERVKNVMQVRNREGVKAPYKNSLVCARELVREHGWRVGLFEGLGTTMVREVPQYVVYFITYENLKVWLEGRGVGEGTSSAVSGGVAGTMVWVPPFYSIDVIKTRIQSAPHGTYNGMIDCILKSHASEGYKVFFRGMGIAQVRAFAVHGSIFWLYEKAMKGVEGIRFRAEGRMEIKEEEGMELEG